MGFQFFIKRYMSFFIEGNTMGPRITPLTALLSAAMFSLAWITIATAEVSPETL
jgi:hypothetical protein